jgi:hypothetical protein
MFLLLSYLLEVVITCISKRYGPSSYYDKKGLEFPRLMQLVKEWKMKWDTNNQSKAKHQLELYPLTMRPSPQVLMH